MTTDKKVLPRGKKTAARKKASSKPAAIGIDLGDKSSRYCILDDDGAIVKEASVETTKKAMQLFSSMARRRIAVEVGSHSPWVSRLLNSLGLEVVVANLRRIPLISARRATGGTRKCWRG